jgi:hypothetical protein
MYDIRDENACILESSIRQRILAAGVFQLEK